MKTQDRNKPESILRKAAGRLLPALALGLMTACASEAPRLASAPAFGACPAGHCADSAAAAAPPALPQPGCSADESIYSPVVWLPFFGPLYDAATNTHPERQIGLSLLATVLPGIGPAIQTGLGARQCLTQCLAADSAAGAGADNGKALLELALTVSDNNCRQFVDSLPGRLADAEADGAPRGLAPLLADTIRAERLLARQILENSHPEAAAIPAGIAAYDDLCSAEHALATLADAGRNQLGGNADSNGKDRKAWLEQNGFSAGVAAARETGGGGQGQDGKRISHINRINRVRVPGAAEMFRQMQEHDKTR